MKRYLIGAAITADAVFTFSLDVNPWQGGVVFVALAAVIILAVFAWWERTELNEVRAHDAELAAWISAHHPGTTFAPYDGDQADRGRS